MTQFQNNEEQKLVGLIKSATQFELSSDEKQRTRWTLREYARMKPIRTSRARMQVQSSSHWFAFRIRPMPTMAAVMIVVLTSGTAFAAENALPGDVLYNIKVSVNEPVLGAFAVSTEAKASWAIERAERRIEEAASLALSGTLDAKTGEELTARLEEHVTEAENEQAELEKSDMLAAARVGTNLRVALLAHADILADVRADVEDDDNRARIDAVIEHVSSRTLTSARTMKPSVETTSMMAADASLNESSKDDSDDEDVEESRSVARSRIEASERLVTRNEGRMRESSRSRLRARLTDAKSTFAEAEDALSRGDKKSANSRYNRALQGAIETRAFLATRANSEHEPADMPSSDTSAASITVETSGSDAGTTVSISASTAATTSTTSDEGTHDDGDTEIEIELESDDDDDDSNNSHKSKGKIKISI